MIIGGLPEPNRVRADRLGLVGTFVGAFFLHLLVVDVIEMPGVDPDEERPSVAAEFEPGIGWLC